MRTLKTLRYLALALALILGLTACGVIRSGDGPTVVVGGTEPAPPQTPGPVSPQTPEPAEAESFRAGALKGPTAMGMVRMMSADGLDTYTLAGSADELTPSLIRGDLDIACVPANLASVLYNRTQGGIVTLAVNTLGVLYIVENGGETVQSLADLRGKTIAAAGKGATPEFGLRYLLEQNGLDPDRDVSIDWKSEHAECVAALASGAVSITLLPQPFVTAAQAKLEGLRMALDLTAEWDALDNGSAMLTGVAVARRAFVDEHPETVDRFLKEYAESVDWVNEHPAEAAELIAAQGIVESAAVAEKALPYCNIVCLTGQEMRDKLSGYLQVLAEASPESVGGKVPGDDFYHAP